MDGLYYAHNGHTHPVNEESPSPEMVKEAERIANGIYNGTIKEGQIDPKLTSLVADKLREAVIKGFGKDLPELEYNTPNFDKLAAIEKNMFQFSGAKNYQELKSLSLALKDGDRVRTFKEFKEEALKINKEYNGTWLKTEYNTAITSAQMAAKWVNFQENKAALPYLIFRAIVDGHTTELCLTLNGTTALVDDPIWDVIFPPNHYGERSTVINSPTGTVTPKEDIVLPDIPKMFQVNLGKEGLAFPPKHPYWIGLPREILQAGEDILSARIFNWAIKELAGSTATAETIGEVNISKAGIKRLIESDFELQTEKNQALYALKNIISNAKLAKSVEDGNTTLHYFKFKIKGKDAYLVIKETNNGNSLYSITAQLP